MKLGYLGLEITRALRSPGTLMFTIGFPAVFYVLEMMLFKDMVAADPVTDYPRSIMVGMSAWGLITAGLLLGTRVVHERVVGWQRQLRLTPLTGRDFLLGKVAVGMAIALPTALVVPIVAVLTEGVQLDVPAWVFATVLMWLGALPFSIMGLLIGQYATKDSAQNVVIVLMLVFAMFGGLFMPLSTLPPWWTQIAKLVPSYWLAEIGRAGFTGTASPLTAGAVLLGWSVLLAVAVAHRYRRDSAR